MGRRVDAPGKANAIFCSVSASGKLYPTRRVIEACRPVNYQMRAEDGHIKFFTVVSDPPEANVRLKISAKLSYIPLYRQIIFGYYQDDN
ncbi:Protein of unknown function [Gryllus bimaculatus]|nr:Protein of unknown function [Gryllus bimaculatus]